jgi:nucleoside phosphorylase
MIAISFALPQEARVLIRRLKDRQIAGDCIFGRCGKVKVGLFFVGVGASRLAWLKDGLAKHNPSILLISGFAGATRSLLRPGDLLAASNFSSAILLDRIRAAGAIVGVGEFASVPKVVDSAFKIRKGRESKCLAVDMESAALADAGRQLGLPYLTVRMISDGFQEEIPALFLRRENFGPINLLRATPFAYRMFGLTRTLADRLAILLPMLT